jgi:transaldolase
VSRVDTEVDRSLEAVGTREALALGGKIAIANSKIAYHRFQEIFYGDPFSAQRKRGAHVQRPLWASTSTKNPRYSDVLYIEELIGPDTVNTIPLATLDAFRDHGRVREATVMKDVTEAREALSGLARLGVDLDGITEKLQIDGISAFASDYERVLSTLDKKIHSLATAGLTRGS